MHFDPNNKIVQLCAKGMEQEGLGNNPAAKELFEQAWQEARDDFEKFTAAHYVARQQEDIAGKLNWDLIALDCALRIDSEEVKGTYPSLYLNVAKGYEDLHDKTNAHHYYSTALSFTGFLPDDGYGKLTRTGIAKGLERVSEK